MRSWRLPLTLLTGASAAALGAASALAPAHAAAERAKELGDVGWGRDLEAARAEAKRTGRPLLILFDEVPGCQTCVRYGQGVLSDPLLVEAVETEFVPVAIYNNLGGRDRQVLERFGEPTWNNPVVRIVDAELRPLAPRVSGDYSQAGLLNAMTAALTKAARPVPGYLALLHEAATPTKVARTHYSMYCFWTGEVCLGELPGVLSTRAGFAGGREVVEVRFDPAKTTRAALDRAAAQCGAPIAATAFRGSSKDDKYQLKHAPWRAVPMTDLQKTRVNARLGRGQDPSPLLSPAQRALYQTAARSKSRLDLTAQSNLRAAFATARAALTR